MAAPRKVFRIEEMVTAPPDSAADSAEAARRHAEIMREIAALRVAFAARASVPPVAHETDPHHCAEMQRLKHEMQLIYDAISCTKQELAALHVSSFHGKALTRTSNELDAITGGTEQATQAILAAAEDIDQAAHTLVGTLTNEVREGAAQDIQDRVIQIFEACNFQDLTGQRIRKVAATLAFIDERVGRMIEIWGGDDGFKGIDPAAAVASAVVQFVHGPRLDGDDGHASQDDIDLMFG